MKIESNEDFILFLSVDIINSTKLKTINKSWQNIITNFYINFQNIFYNQCEYLEIISNRKKRIKSVINIMPVKLWKTSGDEMIFITSIIESLKYQNKNIENKITINKYYELIICYIIAFKNAIEIFNDKNEIKLKGTAWVGDFPINNKKIKIEQHNIYNLGYQYDFIGKSIDIGFRLSKHSTLGKLVISIELAIILLRDKEIMQKNDIPMNITLEYNNIKIYYDNRVELKGVLADLYYPLIWIYINDRLLELELELNYKSTPEKTIFQKYLGEFINKTENRLHYPYIPGSVKGDLYSQKWESYDEELRDIIADVTNR